MNLSGLIDRGRTLTKIGLEARRLGRAATEKEKQRARHALARQFADARGVTMKFGQLLASGEDGEAFQELVTSIEPFPLDAVRPLIEAEIGQPIESVFASFEPRATAASLGQVHRAELLHGGTVAVKVQYPDIAGAVADEMRLLSMLPGVGPVRAWGFDFDGYKTALRENMVRELDYRNEADRQHQFADAVRVDGLIVPKVHMDLTSARVLVQGWEQGVDLDAAAAWDLPTRTETGRILMRTLFKSLFDVGEVHGDPHAGNYAFRQTATGGEVILMDFGCTVPVARSERLALLKMILAVREGGDLNPLDTFAAMGFDADKLVSISGALSTLAHILFTPFEARSKFFVHHWDLKSRFDNLLGDNKWWFRAAGPPSHILLLRGFFGLAQQLDALRAGLDWWAELHAALPSSLIDEARAYQPPPVPDTIAARAEWLALSLQLAENLRVHVTEGEREVVSLSMPGEAVLRLDELIPEDVMAYLRESDEWDVPAILAQVRARGVQPQEVLDFNKGARHYRIWLE